MASADLLLHPVRLRIVQAFLGERTLTTSQLAAELRDVSTASVYRQVTRLADAGVLRVVAEAPVRGAVERTYALALSATQLSPRELADMDADAHLAGFTAYCAALLGAFEQYARSTDDGPDLVADGVGYRMAAVHVSDAEYAEVIAAITEVLQPVLANAPGPGRRRRLIAAAGFPADD